MKRITYHSKKTAQQRQFEQVVEKLRSQLAEMHETIKLMPVKGQTSKTCQRTQIENSLCEVEMCINGIELEDFTPNEFSDNFKLYYS